MQTHTRTLKYTLRIWMSLSSSKKLFNVKAMLRTVYEMAEVEFFDAHQDKCTKGSGVSERGLITIYWYLNLHSLSSVLLTPLIFILLSLSPTSFCPPSLLFPSLLFSSVFFSSRLFTSLHFSFTKDFLLFICWFQIKWIEYSLCLYFIICPLNPSECVALHLISRYVPFRQI